MWSVLTTLLHLITPFVYLPDISEIKRNLNNESDNKALRVAFNILLDFLLVLLGVV